LTTIGASNAAMELMNIKIAKEMQQSVNRKINCDTANVTKTVNASVRQVELIESLRDMLPDLPEKLREAAQLRLAYPELSLTELGAMCVPPVTKSCLNHRMRKLAEVGERAQEEKR
jgi:DNA-binding protein WhiA